MHIFGKEIPIGQKVFFSVPAGSYGNGAEIFLPVIVVRGKEPGPVFWINGEVHGEELNGSIAAWEILKDFPAENLRGTIVATPIANPLALAERNKVSSIDNLDMDTAFPGKETGTWTQRIANILFAEIIEHADYVLSFHTLAPRHLAKPYTVSKIVPGVSKDICMMSRKLAFVFGVEANCSIDLSTADGELPGVMSGALDILCMQHGIPAFMAEMGCASLIERSSIESAKRGIRNVLSYLKMADCERVSAETQILITKRSFIRSPKGGLLVDCLLKPGDRVRKGELIAQTHFFGEKVNSYFAPEDLYIIAARKHPVIHTGERFVFVGTEWKNWYADKEE